MPVKNTKIRRYHPRKWALLIVSAKTTPPTSRALCEGSTDGARWLDPEDEPRDVEGEVLAETMNERPESEGIERIGVLNSPPLF